MKLKRINPGYYDMAGKLKVAVDTANTLEEFPTWDRIHEVMRQIPTSNNYYTYIVLTEYGYQIHILTLDE